MGSSFAKLTKPNNEPSPIIHFVCQRSSGHQHSWHSPFRYSTWLYMSISRLQFYKTPQYNYASKSSLIRLALASPLPWLCCRESLGAPAVFLLDDGNVIPDNPLPIGSPAFDNPRLEDGSALLPWSDLPPWHPIAFLVLAASSCSTALLTFRLLVDCDLPLSFMRGRIFGNDGSASTFSVWQRSKHSSFSEPGMLGRLPRFPVDSSHSLSDRNAE